MAEMTLHWQPQPPPPNGFALLEQMARVVRWRMLERNWLAQLEAQGNGRLGHVGSAALWYIHMLANVFDQRTSPNNDAWLDNDMEIIEGVVQDRMFRAWGYPRNWMGGYQPIAEVGNGR